MPRRQPGRRNERARTPDQNRDYGWVVSLFARFLEHTGAERLTHVEACVGPQFDQRGLDLSEMTSRLRFDQDSQCPDESKAKPSGLDPSQSFVHEQKIGLEFQGQRNRFRFTMIEFASERCHNRRIANVTTCDPVERLDFRRAWTTGAPHHDLVMNGSWN